MLVLLLTHVTTGKSAASVKIEEAESAKLLKNKQSVVNSCQYFSADPATLTLLENPFYKILLVLC